jgi:hypothetical protein
MYQDQKKLYGDDCAVHKSSDGSRLFKKAGYCWRMILAQAGQLPLGPMKMRRKLAQLWCRTGELTLGYSLNVLESVRKQLANFGRVLQKMKICSRFVAHSLTVD